MALCNADRALLSVAGVAIAGELQLDAVAVGVLQSSYLWGYLAGQLPAGMLADSAGGPPVLLGGLLLWSLATAALPLASATPAPLLALLGARVLFGLGSAVALPATSATVSQLVPPERRASSLSIVYAAFNVGSIIGLASTPLLMAAHGWPACFRVFGALGVAWAALAAAALPKPTTGAAATASPAARRVPALRRGGAVQVAALVWVHAVIGWGFFLLLSWIPTYLKTQYPATFESIGALGLVSALPWLVCAAAGLVAGTAADALVARGWTPYAVRTLANRIATLGPATAIMLLPLTSTPAAAVACLCVAMGAQSANYAGFHAYVQDVAGPQAGSLLALTNSGGILCGIVGNIATGVLLHRTGSFSAIFVLTAVLYLSSCLLWTAVIRGEPLFMSEGKA